MGIIGDLQTIAKVIQKAGNINAYQKILEIQETALEMQKENKKLREEIDNLRAELRLKDVLIFKDDAYWIENDKKEIIDGPFCPSCRDSSNLLIHLVSCPDPKYSECPKCKLTLPIQFGKPWKQEPFIRTQESDEDDRY
jgi:hypothetical protein